MTLTNYNGYTNYPTWTVVNWINSDEGLYAYWRSKRHIEFYELQKEIKQTFEDEAQSDEPNVYTDLLNFCLELVNWSEVTEAVKE